MIKIRIPAATVESRANTGSSIVVQADAPTGATLSPDTYISVGYESSPTIVVQSDDYASEPKYLNRKERRTLAARSRQKKNGPRR